VARDFVQKQCTGPMLDMKAPPVDAKTKLQEWLQAKGKPTPTYTVVNVSGPDHAPHFTVEIDIAGYDKVTGEGSSKKQAETNAALNFLTAVHVVKSNNQNKA